MRRYHCAGLCYLSGALLFCATPANAQTDWPKPAEVKLDTVALCGHIYLSSPPRIREAASSIPSLVKAEKWEDVARAIQVLLDSKNSDVIVRQPPGEKLKEWIGANAAANDG